MEKPKLLETEPTILCFQGQGSGEVFELEFNGFRKSNETYPNLPINVTYQGVAKINEFVYWIGGKDEESRKSGQVFRLNINEPTLEWTEVASLNKGRSMFSCAVFNGKLVVAGGNSGSSDNPAELYDEQSKEWKMVSSLNNKRYGNGLVVCGDRLYAVGGWKDSSVECLSAFDENWEMVESMKAPRCYFAAADYGGCVYAIGGYNRETNKSVERYDPRENKWVEVKPMNYARWGHAACIAQDKIIVIGGRGTDEENKYVHEIECYDAASDTWSIVGEIDIDLWGHRLLLL